MSAPTIVLLSKVVVAFFAVCFVLSLWVFGNYPNGDE